MSANTKESSVSICNEVTAIFRMMPPLFHLLDLFKNPLVKAVDCLTPLGVVALVRAPGQVASHADRHILQLFSIGVGNDQVAIDRTAPRTKADHEPFGRAA